MSRGISTSETILASIVILHLSLSVIHGIAHARAKVLLSPASTLFVFTVILIAPIVGLVIQRAADPRAGDLVIGLALAGAFFFGVVNHFLIHGDDHVSQIAQSQRALFGITAASLAATEFFGSAFAFSCVVRPATQSSRRES